MGINEDLEERIKTERSSGDAGSLVCYHGYEIHSPYFVQNEITYLCMQV